MHNLPNKIRVPRKKNTCDKNQKTWKKRREKISPSEQSSFWIDINARSRNTSEASKGEKMIFFFFDQLGEKMI